MWHFRWGDLRHPYRDYYYETSCLLPGHRRVLSFRHITGYFTADTLPLHKLCLQLVCMTTCITLAFNIHVSSISEYSRYHSVNNALSSLLLSTNIKIRIYKTTILLVVLHGTETWSLTLREHRFWVSDKILWKTLKYRRWRNKGMEKIP
jgi:hypothetical protein